jgi:hypothetical protein
MSPFHYKNMITVQRRISGEWREGGLFPLCVHSKEDSNVRIPRNQTAQLLFPISISYICERFMYTPGSVHLFFCSQIGRPIWCEYINRPQIYECRYWDWGRAVSILANFFWFLVQYLCSVRLWVSTGQRCNQLSTRFSTLIKACSRSLLLTLYIREGRQNGSETRR